MDLMAHLYRQRAFSRATFGPGRRTAGVCEHIREELEEIEEVAVGGDGEISLEMIDEQLKEWVDVILLALDGAWRTGASPEDVVLAIQAKQSRNEQRDWPDWRTMPKDKPINHKRSP